MRQTLECVLRHMDKIDAWLCMTASKPCIRINKYDWPEEDVECNSDGYNTHQRSSLKPIEAFALTTIPTWRDCSYTK